MNINRTNACRSFLGIALLALFCLASTAHAQKKIVDKRGVVHLFEVKSSYEGFEKPEDNGFRTAINAVNDPYRRLSLKQMLEKGGGPLSLSTEHARNGNSSLRVAVPNVNHDFRSEIARGYVSMGSDNWYGFSIYIPADWQSDSQANILAQWHAAAAPEGHKTGDGSAYPPIEVDVQDNIWLVKIHWNSTGAGSKGPGFGQKKFDIGKLKKGVWTNFVAHAIWSGDATKGKFELWLNGRKVIDYSGGTEYAGQRHGPYFKIGIYHPLWKPHYPTKQAEDTGITRPVVVFDDEVRTADASGSFDAVKPRGDNPR
ncbi:MAG: polysaccharide lyase [Terriglobia bacterium]